MSEQSCHVEQLPEAQAPGPGNEALPPKITIGDYIQVKSGDFIVELNLRNTVPVDKSPAFIIQVSAKKTLRMDLKGLRDLVQAIEEIRRISNTKTL